MRSEKILDCRSVPRHLYPILRYDIAELLAQERANTLEEVKYNKDLLHKACLDGSAFENMLSIAIDALEKIAIDPNVHWDGKRHFARETLANLNRLKSGGSK